MDLSRIALESQRLTLRSFTPDDAPDVLQAVTPTLTRYLTFDPPPTPEAFTEIWRTWGPTMAAGEDLYLVLRARQTGAFVGLHGLHRIETGEPEAGIWIRESEHRKGYGREAVACALTWAVRHLGVPWILYAVVEENHPSRRLIEGLGGIAVGTRRLKKVGGIDYPEVVYRFPGER